MTLTLPVHFSYVVFGALTGSEPCRQVLGRRISTELDKKKWGIRSIVDE